MTRGGCPDCGHEHAGPSMGGICIGCPCAWRSEYVAAQLRVDEAESRVLAAASAWEITEAFPPIGSRSQAARARAVRELRAAVEEYRAAQTARPPLVV